MTRTKTNINEKVNFREKLIKIRLETKSRENEEELGDVQDCLKVSSNLS